MDAHGALVAFEFWRGYEREITTLAIYAVGIAIYALLVFSFYQNLSRRDLFATEKAGDRRLVRAIRYLLGHLIVFPVVTFLYFAVLSAALFVLAKNESADQILIISMGVVVGVRVTAYLSENASVDLAKLVPLGLLGVFLADPGYLQVSTIVGRFRESLSGAPVIARYFLVLVMLEVALRLAFVTARAARRAGSSPRHRVDALENADAK